MSVQDVPTDQKPTLLDQARRSWRSVAGWALVGVGFLVLVLGWVGVSGEPDVARQLPFLVSGGLGGILLVAVGAALLVADELRSERARLGRIEALLLELRDGHKP